MSGFEFLQTYLRDPAEAEQLALETRRREAEERQREDDARAETAQMWVAVDAEDLPDEDARKRERLRPIVEAYLSGQITRAEYERRLAG